MTTQRLTLEEIAAIRERAERATPGPWSARRWAIPTADQFFVMQAFEDGKEIATAWQGVRYPDMPRISGQEASDNAEFIAHARTDIPRLLDEIERLWTECQRTYTKGYAQGQRDARNDHEIRNYGVKESDAE